MDLIIVISEQRQIEIAHWASILAAVDDNRFPLVSRAKSLDPVIFFYEHVRHKALNFSYSFGIKHAVFLFVCIPNPSIYPQTSG